MKIALVHDYIKEFGGAERVLRVLADMYPEAPIYTAFVDRKSRAAEHFRDRKIKESGWGWLLKIGRLHSPLRFLLPIVWRSIDLSGYDLVITSCSGYIARGFKRGDKTKVVAYCHTPPRWLYGFETPTGYRSKWWGKLYAFWINPFIRYFDYKSSREVDKWIVNSENVARRVKKFYRVSSSIVYPPVEVERLIELSDGYKKGEYCLIVSRLVGAKGIEEAKSAFKRIKKRLVIVGDSPYRKNVREDEYIEYRGWVSDEELAELYTKAKAFIALARDEDFGMTVVEAMACGTPIIAYRGGGFMETVEEGKSGVFVDEINPDSIKRAVKKIENNDWSRKEIQERARRYARKNFEKNIKKAILV